MLTIQQLLPVALHLEVGPCEISPIYAGMTTDVIVQVLFLHCHTVEICMGAASL